MIYSTSMVLTNKFCLKLVRDLHFQSVFKLLWRRRPKTMSKLITEACAVASPRRRLLVTRAALARRDRIIINNR